MDNPVSDGFITADFVGGVWDGKTYDIPFVPEFRVAVRHEYHYINRPARNKDEKSMYDVAVYTYVVNGIYWLSRIETNEA